MGTAWFMHEDAQHDGREVKRVRANKQSKRTWFSDWLGINHASCSGGSSCCVRDLDCSFTRVSSGDGGRVRNFSLMELPGAGAACISKGMQVAITHVLVWSVCMKTVPSVLCVSMMVLC